MNALARAILERADTPPHFFALEGGFHGKTTRALQLTHSAKYRDPWRNERRGLTRLRLGVVGAVGNIGAVLAEVAAERVHELCLFGRPRARRRLEALRDRIEKLSGIRAKLSTDLANLTSCNLIVSATNAPSPVILPDHLADGDVIVCDVATPGDVDRAVARARPRTVLLAGGMVRAPLSQSIAIEGFDLAPGELYGCLAETILLGLSRRFESFSYGPLRADRVREIRKLALSHGFELVPAS